MKCDICEIGCQIQSGDHGRCNMYVNHGDAVTERFPLTHMAALPVSIETIPMTHFRPRAKFLQLGGIGCNFACKGCVSGLFTRNVDGFAPALKPMAPEEMVKKAKAMGCEGIVWCMNDPTVSHHSFLALGKAAKAEGLLVGCSSNIYHTPKATAQLAEVLDFINCGLKGGTDRAYRRCGAPSADPVFRNIRYLYDAGIHIEISIMYSKGNETGVMSAADKISNISKDIPFQIMRFLPFGDAPMHLEPTAVAAENLCQQVRHILPYTYLFNTPGTSYLHTPCPKCDTLLIYREFYGPMGSRVMACAPDAICPCGHKIPMTGPVRKKAYEEFGMSGGYRFTRGLEIIRALSECLGIASEEDIAHIWRNVIENDDIHKLEGKINRIDTYLDLIAEVGRRFDRTKQAEILTSYIQERVTRVTQAVRDRPRPRVYYAMSTPFFALNAERFETQLVAAAGGHCVNKAIGRSGKPGVNLSGEELLYLDPEYIFISGLFSSPEDEFRHTCEKNGVWVDAVCQNHIHAITPGWDFGNPRWILGLMQIANILHPDQCHFHLADETDLFYHTFYKTPPDHFITNRSFYQQPILTPFEPINVSPHRKEAWLHEGI